MNSSPDRIPARAQIFKNWIGSTGSETTLPQNASQSSQNALCYEFTANLTLNLWIFIFLRL